MENANVEQTTVEQPKIAEQPKLVDIEITDPNVALNTLVGFLNLAQRRGVYSIDESGKIWECIKMFQKNN